ncbi:unnamed protein product [Rotaria sp. Silwood2]|nr:unnamed protein product [Rotaria sp. Silwood2]CAF4163436.1 unnamed protein product [Rotaria sp. Silwood2]
MILFVTTDSVWPSLNFIPHALDIEDSWAVVAGYGYSNIPDKDYAALGCLINLSSFPNSSCTILVSEKIYLVPSNVVYYNDLYEMSVSTRGRTILVGMHRLESVIVLENSEKSLNVTRMHTLSYPDSSSFGRAVDWVDDNTIAVLIYTSFQTQWSQSQIFFYDKNSVSSSSCLYTFPNNQQILGSRLSTPYFSRFVITARGNMAILTDRADVLIIPIASIGYVSTWIDTIALVYVFYYVPKPCIGGTYKNGSSLGPCQICPPRTRNPGTLSTGVNMCMPCSNSSSTSFCPLASLADIDLSTIHSYSQAFAYPETADTTNIEDLLLVNMFQISSEPHCLIVSPLFWTLIVGAICFLIAIVMIVLKRCRHRQFGQYRNTMKNLFKRTDIIGKGELWVGGLATIAVLVLVAFSYWFSTAFLRRYPIEQTYEPATFACDQSLVNAQFFTALELLSLPKPDDEQQIFTLLDEQTFILTMEFINTGFTCDYITAQENFIGTNYVPISTQCTHSVLNAITSVTTIVPSHYSRIQINITGPYWIGAIRLCIRGNGLTNRSNILRQLDFCQLYSTFNQAIGRTTIIPIVFIKNINVTKPLSTADPTLYSGLWIPTFGSVELSDEAYYAEFGNYLRYTTSLTVIQILLDERPFYIKNIQEPIVRAAELVFHGLLFTSLCIELFAFTFVLVKLFLSPLVRWIKCICKKYSSMDNKSIDSNEKIKTSFRTSHFERNSLTGQTDSNQTSSLGSDSTLFKRLQREDNDMYSLPEIVAKCQERANKF